MTPAERAEGEKTAAERAAEIAPCDCKPGGKGTWHGSGQTGGDGTIQWSLGAHGCNQHLQPAIAAAITEAEQRGAEQRAWEIAVWCRRHGNVTYNETAMLVLNAAEAFALSTIPAPDAFADGKGK